MTEKELIALIIDHTDGYLSFPFNRPGIKSTIVWSIIKHQHNDKILAMVYTKENELLMNIKLSPAQNEVMRLLNGVEPGYHMNKKYWTTIHVNDTELSAKELLGIIAESARLTS